MTARFELKSKIQEVHKYKNALVHKYKKIITQIHIPCVRYMRAAEVWTNRKPERGSDRSTVDGRETFSVSLARFFKIKEKLFQLGF